MKILNAILIFIILLSLSISVNAEVTQLIPCEVLFKTPSVKSIYFQNLTQNFESKGDFADKKPVFTMDERSRAYE